MSLFSVRLHHTLNLKTPVESSTGPTTTYFDGIGACLCSDCRPDVFKHFERELFALGAPDGVYYNSHGKKAWPIATGASGAFILGLLGRGTYLRARDKQFGPLWHNLAFAQAWKTVALVDDCIFTGDTMAYMQEQCELVGLKPVGEISLYERKAT